MKNGLSEKWIKASIAGTIWAASEIVLGSFLHNLRVPFSGNILTAIGLVVLISISYIWSERGLFWRAGLICALMKTLSPSAVIFGPMIAIFTEAVIMELFVRLLGKTILGYAIGSMLAMSWNLVQKILNYIIFYGSSIIDVYSNLLKLAQKQLDIRTEIIWMPIIILVILYSLFGLLAAITGMRVGREMKRRPFREVPHSAAGDDTVLKSGKGQEFNYSVIWLIANICLLAGSFVLLNKTSWMVWSLSIALIITLWAVRYKRALRQLSKPGFWIMFVLITLLTAFVFTKAQPGENSILKGLLTGVQMNFRAAVVIVGFAVLGTELYNPVVRNFFLKTSFKNLPLALELSAESLPLFIAGIPDFKTLLKDPVFVFYKVISHANLRLSEIKKSEEDRRKVFIVTGSIRGGKTTFARNIASKAGTYGITACGILSERKTDGLRTVGYDLVSIESGRKKDFLRENGKCSEGRIGRFKICGEGLSEGRKILSSVAGTGKMLVIVDEVGMLELQDGGWSDCITDLLGKSPLCLVMTVRDIYVDDIKRKWQLKDAAVINISKTDHEEAVNKIIQWISYQECPTTG